MREIGVTDVLKLAAMFGGAVLLGVLGVAVAAWVDARDRRAHEQARFWRVLDEDLPDEWSEVERSMLGFNGEVTA